MENKEMRPDIHLLDISQPMIEKAKEFLIANLVFPSSYNQLDEIETSRITGVCVLNFSFLFANVDDDFRLKLEELIMNLKNTTDQLIILNQNSANNDLNLVWDEFKEFLVRNGFSVQGCSLELNISYSNQFGVSPNRNSSLSYEVLSN